MRSTWAWIAILKLLSACMAPPAGREKEIEDLLALVEDPAEDTYARWEAGKRLVALGDPDALERFTGLIDDLDRRVRFAVVHSLDGCRDPRAVEALIRALDDQDSLVRCAAARAIGNAGNPAAVEPLLRRLPVVEGIVRTQYLQALAVLHDPRSAPALLDVLKEGDESWTEIAATGLGLIPEADIAPRVRSVFESDARPLVKLWAAFVLFKQTGDRAALQTLLEGLQSAEPWVRCQACTALGRSGSPAAVEPLIAMLREGPGAQRDAARLYVLHALASLKDPRGIEPVIEALFDPEVTLVEGPEPQRSFSFIPFQAALALRDFGSAALEPLLQKLAKGNLPSMTHLLLAIALIGDPQGLDAVVGVLGDAKQTPEARLGAAYALSMRKEGYRPALGVLIIALKAPDSSLRSRAADCLGRIPDPSVVPSLVQAMKDESTDVRRSACLALERIGDRSAVPALVDALSDADEPVRNGAVKALRRVTGRKLGLDQGEWKKAEGLSK